MLQPNALFTCRYWAFGPACPNADEKGNVICAFAHWDTGRLASEMVQKGTCRYWLQGNCLKGQACWYEHRKTGVDGMWQGPVRLTGLNLEIANAAVKGGFDTWNHSALYDLIWTVKRVAFRHCKSTPAVPPPKDPNYPDRYRPSGLGDNTSRKRPPPAAEPPTMSAITIERKPVVLKTGTRKFRYCNKKKNKKPISNAPMFHFTDGEDKTGTQYDPVNLLSDDERQGAAAKKQKMHAGHADSVKPEANMSRVRASGANAEAVNGGADKAEFMGQRNTSGSAFTQQDDFVSLLDANMADDQRLADTVPLSPRPPLDPQRNVTGEARSREFLVEQLQAVRANLMAAADKMVDSRSTMKKLFDSHADDMNLDRTLPALTFLSKCLEMAETEAIKGTRHVSRVQSLAVPS